MKVVIGQTNPTPGDFDGNVAQIKESIHAAKEAGASLVVTPEMSIPGYLCRDSMFTEGFIDMNLRSLTSVIKETENIPDVTVVVGYVDRNRTGAGKPFHNMAATIKNGAVIATYKKQLLPFYDVFDEGRYFEPGADLSIVEVDGTKFALLICEDGWENDKGSDSHNYHTDPIAKYKAVGINNFIWLNSSPYVIGKPARRQRMLQDITKTSGGTIVYTNQIGGMDDLVFDGNSMVVAGGTVFYTCRDKEGAHIIDLEKGYGIQLRGLDDGSQELKRNLVLGLKDYAQKTGFKQVVVASSGGIDSALVLCLACEAFGAENVHAIRMPSVYSSKGSVDDALTLHKNLGCHDYLMPIEHVDFLASANRNLLGGTGDGNTLGTRICEYRKVADENIQARLRAINLMHFSNAWGCLALTTGNKSENATGYCTLNGDMAGGFAPVQDLWKTQVYEIAGLYCAPPQNVMPKEIMSKAPSAELAPGQTDEASLLPYSILDLILCAYVEQNVSTFDSFVNISATGRKEWFDGLTNYAVAIERVAEFAKRKDAKTQYNRIIRLVDLSEFKRRQAAPGIKVSKVAFGTGRRFPIARKRW